jgi:hypothetical protein
MTHDPTRDCEHGRLKGKCDVCDLQAEAEADRVIIEYHEATIKRLQYEVDAIPAIKEERDALAAELTRLKASIVLDKMADNARALGLDYEPAPVQEPVAWVPVTETLLNEQHPWLYKTMWIAMKDGRVLTGRYEWRQGRNPDRFYPDGAGDEWAYDASHVMPLQAPAHPSTTPPGAQPAPVKTYSGGKPWPVAPKPWVGLTLEDKRYLNEVLNLQGRFPVIEAIEAKLKEKNT